MFFVIVFGIALTYVRSQKDALAESVDSVFEAFEVGAEAMFVIVREVLEFGVLGVFALMASGIGTEGIGLFSSLGELVLAVTIAIVIHIGFTYLVFLMGVVADVSSIAFLSGAKDAIVTAFATRSSSGTLPVTMRNADEDLQIAERVYSFTLVGFVTGVDPILGRIATMNNVTGDFAVSTVVGKWNDGLDRGEGVWSRNLNSVAEFVPGDD